MAKKNAGAAKNAGNGATEPEIVEIEVSAKTEKLIAAIKRPFTAFTASFAALEKKRADLAGPFMKAANAWMADTGMGFVDFVRHMVPSIGTTAAEYNAAPAYNSARYLKRQAEKAARAEREPESAEARAVRIATAPAPPLVAMARLIASVLEIIPQDQIDRLKQAMRAELHWADRRVDAIMEAAQQDSEPLVSMTAPKGHEMPPLKLSFPPSERERHAKAA